MNLELTDLQTDVLVRELSRIISDEWRRRLVCSQCGSRDVDMVVTGEQAG